MLKSKYKPDFLYYDEIIVEIKALKKYGDIEAAQIINAIKVAKKRVGVLINFGEPSLYWKRYVINFLCQFVSLVKFVVKKGE